MSEETAELPKELLESIKDAVSRKIKLSVRKRVKLEVKGDKLENKVLALASHRAYLLTARIPAKVEHSFNYLEINGITCSKPNQLVVEHDRGLLSMKLGSAEDVDEVVGHIGGCQQRICPGLPALKVMKKLVMEPPERLSNLQALWESQNVPEPGPCGGFSHTYMCVCDWLGLPYREEVQWDVDTIYLTHDTRELNLQDFIHLENRDLVAIIAVLELNQWFTKLSAKDCKLSADVCDQILRVVSRSTRLEELVLDNAGLKADFAQKLANALAINPSSGLHTISLANNSLEDRGMYSLSVQFAKLRNGLKHLNLSKTSLSPKGVNVLAQSLSANQPMLSTLTHLDLSGNGLRGDDLPNLYNFLGQPNNLTTLDLSNTDCSLDLVCAALLRGSVEHLAVFNVSKGVVSHRKGKEVPPSFKSFFSSATALRSITLSGTKLPPEALKALLLGLACNPNLKEVSLDLSGCELRSAGSQILEGCVAEIPNISSLDISDNGLDSDLTTLLVWLAKNRSIRHLSLGKNFNNIKSKNLAPVLDNLVHMIQEEESPLTSLSLADSKLKTDMAIVLNALGSNTSLTRLDISGNGMGDMGAKMLAKALQINSKLRTVIWDKNNISPQGLQDVAAALEKNFTIRFMPIPIIDASQALKSSPEKTEDALMKIESYLFRNHETRRYLQEQAYRLQQGIVTTTTQQVIDRICVKVQDHLNSLRYTETDAIQEDMKVAENLMKDARNSKTLLRNLYHLGSCLPGDTSIPSASPIQEKLESMAGEVTRVMDEQLQSLLLCMVDAAEGLCPHVMKKAKLRQDLIKASSSRVVVPRGFVKTTLLEQSGVDIINKISEVKLSMASFLSDRIVDEILESLSSSQNTLANHLVRKGQPLLQQVSVESEAPEEKAPKQASPEQTEADRLEELDHCLMTPKSKRKSIHSRMLRPVSHAFEMEFDLDKALEDVPIHIEDPPPAPKMESRTSVVLCELPSEEVTKLQHFTKLRPRRDKRTHPKKTPVRSTPSLESEQNSLMGRLDEGMDDFFSKTVTKIGLRRPTLKTSACPEGEKKRDSRKSGFLNLIKSRSSKTEKSHPAPPAAAATPAVTATAAPAASAATATTTATPATAAATELPSCPKASPRGPAHEPSPGPRAPPPDRGGSPERPAESKTPDPAEEQPERDGRASPQGGPRYGVQVMGMGILAEMRAKQEKRAAATHKTPNPPSSTDKTDGSEAVKGHSAPPDSRAPGPIRGEGGVASSEKAARNEGKPEAAPRMRNPPSSPKPSPQGSKPSPTARPTVPHKPRTSSSRSIDEGPESPGGNVSPKLPPLPQGLKRAPSDKENEGQSSPLFGGAEEVDLSGDSSPFDYDQETGSPKPRARVRPSRQCSASTASDADEEERRKSLPRPVRPASVADVAPHQSSRGDSPEDHDPQTKEPSPDGDREEDHGGKPTDSEEEPDEEDSS
ncbi:F-actin-uncapping protein LRRC16A-like isoform X1 [Anguilla rostrata]|uniref:F-actin-uncapping protein LRRC16A-like isoform X1 n=1 Tax=Anguilla rostrata TaxID=7938 RepID=UPI0030CF4B07